MVEPSRPRHDAGMQSSLLADDDLPEAASLVAAVTRPGTPGHFDEWRAAASGTAAAAGRHPAPHWQRFFNTLGTDGWADLAARALRVQDRVREDGATYNVYAEGSARPWPLELLPFIVQPQEWAQIEAGVLQRARLMAATLSDIYGPQTLLRDALLPASLIFAHPQYLRPAHGLWPAGAHGQGQGLHVAAFDRGAHRGGMRLAEMPAYLTAFAERELVPLRQACLAAGRRFIMTTDHGLSFANGRLTHGGNSLYERVIFRCEWGG